MKLRDRTKKKKRSLRDRLTRRKTHRLAAHVSREDQWDYDVPNIQLSRAFVVVVVLHIVAVGGILVFEVLKPDGRGSASIADSSDQFVPNESRGKESATPDGVKIGDPRTEGLESYIVRAGDTLRSIANKHDVPFEALESQNDLGSGGRIYPGRNLFIPNMDSVVAATHLGTELAGSSSADGASNGAAAHDAGSGVPTPVIPIPIPAATPELPGPPIVAATPVPTPEPAPARMEVVESPSPDPEPAAQPVRPVSSAGGGVYVMARGDTPYSIARRYAVNVSDLLRANNISDPTKIQIGQKLKIPNRR